MRAFTIGLALLVVACTSSPAVKGGSPAPTGSQAAPGSAIRAFVPIAERFVEAHRGLKFKTEVTVNFVAADEFRRRLDANQAVDEAGYAVEAKVLHALGLLDGKPDLAAAERSLEGSNVIGFYDPKTKDLVVRGVDARPSVRQVLVHELTHALQDQWFGIDRPAHDDDESDLAFRTLVEGDAVRIQDLYVASLNATDRRQVASDSAGDSPPASVPPVLIDLEAFPYLVGPRFATRLAAAGQARLDAAFTTPPTATAQVIEPERFLSGETLPVVDFPEAGGAVIDRGVLGEFGLDLVLARLADRGAISSADVRATGTEWKGDRYVAWDSGSKTCVRIDFVMTSPGGSQHLLTALRAFAAMHPGTTIEGRGPVLLTACA